MQCRAAYEDWARSSVRGIGGLVLEGQEIELFADFGIDKTDATWVTRLGVGYDAAHAPMQKFFVREIVEMSKGFWR